MRDEGLAIQVRALLLAIYCVEPCEDALEFLVGRLRSVEVEQVGRVGRRLQGG
jgi:hypothetical protein